ncbi:hypothetical protein OAO18_06015 [Francisellaceae bacterium]|nr:hypothetical protein [Francisellaceae bacterium]
MRVHGLIIDPQFDFCWPGIQSRGINPNNPSWAGISNILKQALGAHYYLLEKPGNLYVPGADEDMNRLANMIKRIGNKIDHLHVTLDSHHKVDQAHPIWWKDKSGNHPEPFTILSTNDDKAVKSIPDKNGDLQPTTEEYQTNIPSMMHVGGPTGKGSFGYLEALNKNGRYPHVVWPEHCLIGTLGHIVWPNLMEAFLEWENKFAHVNYVTKGINIRTEHYSAVHAEAPDSHDPLTQTNKKLIEILEEADLIFLAGEARSHCLANTVMDIAKHFSDPKYIKKLVLLTDATSDVPGFESFGEKFIEKMVAKGMQLSTTETFLQ